MKFLADENVKGWYFNALLSRFGNDILVRVQDVGLRGAKDDLILEWAARHERILITHDFQTMPKYAYERVSARLPMPGVFQIDERSSVQSIVDEFLLIVECSEAAEWRDVVSYIPRK